MLAWKVIKTSAPLEAVDVTPPVPQGAEILVQVSHCGVCHSDLHLSIAA